MVTSVTLTGHAEGGLQDSHRVLVVDDEQAVAELIRDALQQSGFEVKVALDGFTAESMLESFSPAVMTLDLGMPAVGGLSVIRHVRAAPGLAHTKILVVSGLDGAELHGALSAGANDVLEKPFDVHALVEKVSRLAGVTESEQV